MTNTPDLNPSDLPPAGDPSTTAASTRSQRLRRGLKLHRRGLAVGSSLLCAGGFAVVGTLSTFTASGTRTQTISSGSFAFTLGDPTAPAAPFTTAISGMAPGDMGDREVSITNPSGGLNYASIALAASATTSSLLNTDATNGLQLTISDCTVPWTQTSSTSAATCSGTMTTPTAATPLATITSSGVTYTSGLASLTNGGVDYLRFHYLLPTASTGTAGLSSTVQYTLTATQATGGAYH